MKETARKSTAIVHGSEGAVISEEAVCRVCLDKWPHNRLLSLFLYWTPPWKYERSADDCIANQLVKLAGTQIKQSDGYPQQICFGCFASFKEAYTFYYKVRHHDNVMRSKQLLVQSPSMSMSEMMQGGWHKPALYDSSDGDVSEKITPYPAEVKQEMLSDEEAESVPYPDMEIKQEVDIKIEPEELMAQSHSSERINGLTDVKVPPTSSIVISSSFSMISHLVNERKRSRTTAPVVEQAETRIKEEVLDTESSDVDSDFPLDCMLCCKEFQTISGLKAHVISSHSYRAVMRKSAYIHNKAARLAKDGDVARDRKNGKSRRNAKKRYSTEENTATEQACLVCGKAFTTKESLSAHARLHRTKCEHCDQHFPSFVSLVRHTKECAGKYAQRRKTKTVQQLRREYVAEAVEEPIKRRKSTTSQYERSEGNQKYVEMIYPNIHKEAHHHQSITDSGPKPEESTKKLSESTATIKEEKECDEDMKNFDKVDGQNEALDSTECNEKFDETIYPNIHKEAHHHRSIADSGPKPEESTKNSSESTVAIKEENECDEDMKNSDKVDGQNEALDETGANSLLNMLENRRSADDKISDSQKKFTDANDKSADERNPLGSPKNKTDVNESSADEKNPSGFPKKDTNVNEKLADEKKTAPSPTEMITDDSTDKARLESLVEENPETINLELSKEVTITLELSDEEIPSRCPSTDGLSTVKVSIDRDQVGTELLKENERKDAKNSEISEKTTGLEQNKREVINSDLKLNHESVKGDENTIVDPRESELELKLAAFENNSGFDLNTNITDIANVALSDSDVLESGKRLGCE